MSRALRERLEAAQANHRDVMATAGAAPRDETLLRTLQDETERFERTASALRRSIDRHRERQRLLDDLRSGTPLHWAAWFAVPVMGWRCSRRGCLWRPGSTGCSSASEASRRGAG